MHTLTNTKMSAKNKVTCMAEQTKEGLKDSIVLAGTVATTAGAASIATGVSTKVGDAFENVLKKGGAVLSKISIENKGNLKDIITNTKIGLKLASLPTPAKAALATTVGAFAILFPTALSISAAKTGYIEGQHENK